ncbi:MAG: hypothetical protein E7319_08645 [Clostridiales bacterium]|nr:hypothetical protein [Clostridiales bacterium]
MNGLVRQLAVLSVLWALCELLLADGKQQRMVRMAISLMVMVILLSSLAGVISGRTDQERPVFSVEQPDNKASGYDRIAVLSVANQAKGLCVRTAQRAGYQADAVVYLHEDGSLEQVELFLARGNTLPLMDENTLAQTIAKLLSASPEQVRWETVTKEAGDE